VDSLRASTSSSVLDQTAWGIFVLAWGFFIVSSVDNVLKPILISRGSDLPFMLVMLGRVRRVVAFGFIGVFLGPVLLALAFMLIKEWARRPTPQRRTTTISARSRNRRRAARALGATAGSASRGAPTSRPCVAVIRIAAVVEEPVHGQVLAGQWPCCRAPDVERGGFESPDAWQAQAPQGTHPDRPSSSAKSIYTASAA
jgi:hypothetical protein